MIPVEGRSDLYRDPVSGAIINRVNDSRDIMKASRSKYEQEQNRMEQLENDVSEIKNLLTQLLEKK